MVITPLSSVGLDARVPQPSSGVGEPDPGVVVITVKDGGGIEVNQEGAVTPTEVPSRLRTLFLARGNVTLFVRADSGLTFEPVAHLIDLARGAGLERIALMRH